VEQYDIARKLMSLYCFNKSEYREMYVVESGEVGYRHVDGELTIKNLFDHLDGKRTLSVYGRKNRTVFMTLDIDTLDTAVVADMMRRLEGIGIAAEYLYPSTSGYKGFHIDVFFDKPVKKSLVENLYYYLRRDRQVAEYRMECFPLRHNAIKIPLGVNLRTGNRCWYLDRETLAAIEDDGYVYQVKRMPGEKFEDIVIGLNKKAWQEDFEKAKLNVGKWKKKERYQVRKYSVAHEPRIMQPGERHNCMRRRSVYLRSMGADEDEIFADLMAWVGRQDPALINSPIEEIEKDARAMASSVVRKFGVKVKAKKQTGDKTEWLHRALRIGALDIRKVLLGETKSERKIAFLICVYCLCYGKCCMSYERMGEAMDMSHLTAQKAVRGLLEKKVISIRQKGGLVKVDGEPHLMPNAYVFDRSDRGYGSVEFVKPYVEFKLDDVKDHMVDFYYRVLTEIIDPLDVGKYLTGGEKKMAGVTIS